MAEKTIETKVEAAKSAKPKATVATMVADRRPSVAEVAWERDTLAPTLAKSPERDADFTTVSSYPIRRLYTEADLPRRLVARKRFGIPRTAAVHPRHSLHDVSRKIVDHAPVRRIRHRAGHQRALPLFALTRANRIVRRFRPAHSDGLRRGSRFE